MYKILNRARAIELYAIRGTAFPGTVNLDPLEAPIFRLSIINNLLIGPVIVRYKNKNIEVVPNGKSITMNFQKVHSYDQQNCLFPEGAVISLTNTSGKNDQFVYLTGYTYYWEV